MHSNTSKKLICFPLLALFYSAISTDANARAISSDLWSDDSEPGTVTEQASVAFSMKFCLGGTKENCEKSHYDRYCYLFVDFFISVVVCLMLICRHCRSRDIVLRSVTRL